MVKKTPAKIFESMARAGTWIEMEMSGNDNLIGISTWRRLEMFDKRPAIKASLFQRLESSGEMNQERLNWSRFLKKNIETNDDEDSNRSVRLSENGYHYPVRAEKYYYYFGKGDI